MNRSKFIQGMNSDILLSDKERKCIIKRSIERQSWKLKCTIVMEELAELQQEISKQIRGNDDQTGLLEEMADVYICLSYLESIFGIDSEDIKKAVDVKLEREKQTQNSRRY